MTREDLATLQHVAKQKADYLRSKTPPGQMVPAWVVKELAFVQDFEQLGLLLFEEERKNEKLTEQYKRLVDLVILMESAFNQLLQNRPTIVNSSRDIGPYNIGPNVFFRLASLMPAGVDKNQTLQFYHEFTSQLLHRRNNGPETGNHTEAAFSSLDNTRNGTT